MSPPKGKKSVGGRRAVPSSLKPGAESAVMTLQDVVDYLHCHTSTVSTDCSEKGKYLDSRWAAAGGF